MSGLWIKGAWQYHDAALELVANDLRQLAGRGVCDGSPEEYNRSYILNCTARHYVTGTCLIFSRDIGHHSKGWFKNPDYERCYHLSLSYRDPVGGEELPHRFKQSEKWVRAFFGHDLRWAWSEPPVSKVARRQQTWHWRLFCGPAWTPIKPRGEVYSREFTEKGWKSASELGFIIESTLVPG